MLTDQLISPAETNVLEDQTCLTSQHRVELVQRLAERLTSDADQVGTLIAEELGKPIRFAKVEVQRASELLLAAAERFKSQPRTIPAGLAQIRRRPHGVVAVITPSNNPIFIPLGKIIPAVLYGNSVIWKPAPESQVVSRRIMHFLDELDWPSELVRLLEGDHCEAQGLMNNPQVAAVTFTGSESAGRAAQEICAQRNVPLQAELGGNNAAIVWPDADLRAAAKSIAAGAFEMAGQRCTANRRVIVHQDCHVEFLELLVQESARLVWGDPLSRKTQIGPLVSQARCERVAAVVGRAVAEVGPAMYPHGTVVPESPRFAGCWYPPTIICCDDPELEIVQEETFGPVLVVQTARDWSHAIGLCNGVRHGLAAAIFTRARQTVERFLEQAEAGMLKVNQSTSDAIVDVPFCAWKSSGVGPPKHGTFTQDFYTRPQTVYPDLCLP